MNDQDKMILVTKRQEKKLIMNEVKDICSDINST